MPNFVCVLTNERYKTHQTGFSFCRLGHAPGVELLGAKDAQVVNFFNFKHGHVAYQIEGDDEQNRMQLNFHTRVKLVNLGWYQKVKYHFISITKSISKEF